MVEQDGILLLGKNRPSMGRLDIDLGYDFNPAMPRDVRFYMNMWEPDIT